MASLNKFIGIGNITKDPVTRYSSSGDAITNITIACNETWKDKNGEKQEKAEFVNVTFYKKLAEIAGEFLKKGALVYVEGKMETRKYTDKNGVERYATGIVANELKMLGSKQGNTDTTQSRTSTSQNSSGFDDMQDDVPF